MQNTTQPEAFVAHGFLYQWQPNLIWLHVISDLAITLAFFAIPIAFLTFLFSQKKSFPYAWTLVLCSLFIFTCGISHLLAMISIWYPIYYWHGIAKAVTAVLAVGTALILLPTIPCIFRACELNNEDEQQPPHTHHNQHG